MEINHIHLITTQMRDHHASNEWPGTTTYIGADWLAWLLVITAAAAAEHHHRWSDCLSVS